MSEAVLTAQVTQYKKKTQFQIARSVLTAVAGVAVLGYWLSTRTGGPFDFYQGYLVAVSVLLILSGVRSIIRSVKLLRDKDGLAKASQRDASADRSSDLAVASGFRLFLGIMLIALIFIGEYYSYSGFIAAAGCTLLAVLCYVFSMLFFKHK